MPRQQQPYGTWASPLSSRALAESLSLNDVQWDDTTGTLVWLENRGAKGVLVMQQGTQGMRDLTSELNVRGTVGYGGGGFTVGGGAVYFATPGGRLYRQSLDGGGARPITPSFGDVAAPRLSPDGRWLIYVFSYEGRDGLALVDSEGTHWPRLFATGTDFVMQPAWHPAGDHVAYVVWNHPQMPWDGTELRLASIEYDRAGVPSAAATETLAGDAGTAITQPEFSPDGRYLAYLSDASGWTQLVVYDLARRTQHVLTGGEAEYGLPAWVQGIRTYSWMPDSQRLVAVRNSGGIRQLWEIRVDNGEATLLKGLEQYTDVSQVSTSMLGVAVIGSSSVIPPRVVSLPMNATLLPTALGGHESGSSIQVVVEEDAAEQIHRRSSTETLPVADLSVAEPVSWVSHDGELAHGLYYPPSSETFESNGLPPLIVYVHGGPTSQVTAGYHSSAQFFATRGYALLMVNHRGSTGYGKAYMNKLRGAWGEFDVEDSASGAAYLAAQGRVDAGKFVIMGGSAGGFTVLQSLVTKVGFYKAGVCLYGVSDQFALAMETHKFEARYTDSMLGPLPEAAALYRERSPIYHAEKIVDPIIVFQGEDDKVVPRSQSDRIVESLKARNVPHAYHVYAGEGHGWRKPETIEHYLNAVVQFLKEKVVFG